MKKLISAVLVLTLVVGAVFALSSCKKEKDIYSVVGSSKPTSATTYTTYEDASGREFAGAYTLKVDGDNFIFEYSYERMRTSEEAKADGTDELVKKIDGVLYYKNGKSETEGAEFDSSLPAINLASFALRADKLDGVSISEDGFVLTATVKAANAEDIFGVALATSGDISLRVETDATYARRISVSYTTASGAEVTIETSYQYAPVKLEFPKGL